MPSPGASLSHLILSCVNELRRTESPSKKNSQKNPTAQEGGSDFPKTRATAEDNDGTGNRVDAEAWRCLRG